MKELSMNQDNKSTFFMAFKDSKVSWREFNKESLKIAKAEKKPLFIHLGYSTSHLSTDLQYRVFEDSEIASFLNENFISILIDKELSPHLDQYFQKMMILQFGENGWPANIFLTSELKPLFLGTYLPLEVDDKYPGFLNIIKNILQSSKEKNSKRDEDFELLIKKIKSPLLPNQEISFEGRFPSPNSIFDALTEYEDKENGGYGKGIKHTYLSFMEWAAEQIVEGVVEKEFSDYIIMTLEKILASPVYDHVGGGIHHFSFSSDWQKPNFEKHLNDQAMILKVLSKISVAYPSPLFLDAIIQTLEYLNNEMFDDERGFFTSQGSISEGIEGLYFCYTAEEFDEVFQDSEIDLENLKKWFMITEQGDTNYKLNTIKLDLNKIEEIITPENWEIVRNAKKLLFQKRFDRIPPKTNPQSIASSSFKLISALCDVIQYCKIGIIQKDATNLLNKALANVYQCFFSKSSQDDFHIHHSSLKNSSKKYLEDYVAFADAHSRLYEITANKKFKKNALKALDFIEENFLDNNKLLITSKGSDSAVVNFENLSSDLIKTSPISTYILFIRKWCFENSKYQEIFEGLFTQFAQCVLFNPLAHGEGLRSLIYPEEVYKKLVIPSSWKKNENFLKIIPYFSSRFLINYHDQDSWIFEGLQGVEKTGEGLEEFENFLFKKN